MRRLFHKFLIALLLVAVAHSVAQQASTHSCDLSRLGRELLDVSALASRLLSSAASVPGMFDEFDVLPPPAPGECPFT